MQLSHFSTRLIINSLITSCSKGIRKEPESKQVRTLMDWLEKLINYENGTTICTYLRTYVHVNNMRNACICDSLNVGSLLEKI